MTLQELAEQLCTGPFDSVDLHFEAGPMEGWRLEIDTEGHTYEAEGDTVGECVADIVRLLDRRKEESRLAAWNHWACGVTVVIPAA